MEREKALSKSGLSSLPSGHWATLQAVRYHVESWNTPYQAIMRSLHLDFQLMLTEFE
jgi:hypothetical protein